MKARLDAWIEDARAALTSEREDWAVIATLSKARALLGPDDATAARWRALHDAYCKSTLDTAAALDELARTPARSLGHPPTAIGRDAFAAKLVGDHCDTGDAIDRLCAAQKWRSARAAAQYGPAYVLAWTDAPASLAPLFALALADDVAKPAAIDRAIATARAVHGRIAIDPTALDVTFFTRWAQGLADQLAAADLAVAAPAKGAARAAKKTPRPALAPPPDWAAIERAAIDACVATIARHAEQPLAALALDANPPYEPVLIALDTAPNQARTRAAVAKHLAAARQKALRGPDAWRIAREQLAPGALDDALHDPAEFARHDAGEFRLSGLEGFDDRGKPPSPRGDGEPWSHGQTRLLLWRVLEALASHRALRAKHVARPFLLISCLHDERPVLVRVLEATRRAAR